MPTLDCFFERSRARLIDWTDCKMQQRSHHNPTSNVHQTRHLPAPACQRLPQGSVTTFHAHSHHALLQWDQCPSHQAALHRRSMVAGLLMLPELLAPVVDAAESSLWVNGFMMQAGKVHADTHGVGI